MGYQTTFTGHLSVTPALNRREVAYLRKLANPDAHWSAQGRVNRPSDVSPWWPSDDGAVLAVRRATHQPVAEWAVYLATHLLGPLGPRHHGRALKGFTYDHVVSGKVRAEGMSSGDRWTLLVDRRGVRVRRSELPCPSCWVGTLLAARPSNAYRFTHPVRAANLIDGHLPRFDHDSLEEDCLHRTWAPMDRTEREITWPWTRHMDPEWWIDLTAHPSARPLRPAA